MNILDIQQALLLEEMNQDKAIETLQISGAVITNKNQPTSTDKPDLNKRLKKLQQIQPLFV